MRILNCSLLATAFFLAVLPATAGAAGNPRSGAGLPARQVDALIALHHPAGLDRFVRAVGDPASPRYRHYATVEQLVARFGARPRAKRRVLGWLSAHGVQGTVLGGGAYVLATMPHALAGELVPSRDVAGVARGRLGRRVPAAVRGAIAGVSLLDRGPVAPAGAPSSGNLRSRGSGAPKKDRKPYESARRHSGTASGCPAGSSGGYGPGYEPFTPNQYLTAYGDAAMHAKGIEGQGQTVAVVEAGRFKRSDIATFGRCFGIKPPPTAVVHVGKPAQPGEDDETTLDISMLSVGAPKLDRIYVYEGGAELGQVVRTTAAALGSRGHHPNVISISQGACESTLTGQLQFRDAFDRIFATAAGAGISVLVSAGDQGSSACYYYSGEEGKSALGVRGVSMPASSPYATAVGGTNLTLSKRNRIEHEFIWNDSFWRTPGGIYRFPYAGGGGGSVFSPHTPWWQRDFDRPYGPGRKLPDVSALADDVPGYALFCTTRDCGPQDDAVYGWTRVGGTSAATPVTAAGIALVNQYAAEHGQRPVGFLNPLLYALGADPRTRGGAFHDVVNGNNDIWRALRTAEGPLGCCSAKPGYDWASGWGSLKVPGFAKLALAATH